ncbi:MAG: mechanosensitive ion channel family protein, partial [Dolichospermum sp.]
MGTYVAIRFTYALIDHFTSTIVSGGALLTPETSARLQLSISTFSGVSKSITTFILIAEVSLLE